jgi:hypothetical protein
LWTPLFFLTTRARRLELPGSQRRTGNKRGHLAECAILFHCGVLRIRRTVARRKSFFIGDRIIGF